MTLLRRRAVFSYPTGSSFASKLIVGFAAGLFLAAASLYMSGARVPMVWLVAPGVLAVFAAILVGPGMREQFRVDPESGCIQRRVYTMGVPRDESVLSKEEIRIAAIVRMSDAHGKEIGAFCVVADHRARWLILSFHRNAEKARRDRELVASGLGLLEGEYRCGPNWTPYWGRLQPAPPPQPTLPPLSAPE